MQLMDQHLSQLISAGSKLGYLTYDEVNAYLPDEDVNPEKLNRLILAIERRGIRLIETSEKKRLQATGKKPEPNVAEMRPAAADAGLTQTEMPKASEDPIRMYLSQMAEIPLLSREEEIALAKKIEITRRQFRRALLESDYALRSTVGILKRVHAGELPFDRTIKVSLTERLTKEQILARMPHNLKLLDVLLKENREAFAQLLSKSTPAEDKLRIRGEFIRRRWKTLQLVEELSLRTRRVQPLIKQLEKYTRRMLMIRDGLAAIRMTTASRTYGPSCGGNSTN